MDTAKRKRGRPIGTPGGGKYGCATKVVRVPLEVADNIAEILRAFEAVKSLVDDWSDRTEEVTSPRYDQAKRLLIELRSYLGNDD